MPVVALHHGIPSIPPIGVIAISSIFIVCGLVLIYMGLKDYLQFRKIKKIPISKANSAQAGLVKLYGTAQSLKPETSPVNGAPCVFWRVTGWFYYEGGFGKGDPPIWKMIYLSQLQGAFYIADETGRMLVMPGEADIRVPSHSSYKGYISPKQVWEVSLDGRALKFIESLDENSRARFLEHEGKQICVTEYIIRESDPLFVFGTATPVDIGSGNESRNILVVRKDPTDRTMYIAGAGEGFHPLEQLSLATYLALIFGFVIIAVTVYITLRQLGI
jgi:hypothetical protein